MNDIQYPDIDFLETDTETIVSNMIALYEQMQQSAGRKNYQVRPASPERLLISWMAAIIVQQRVLINEAAKMNVPRYAAKSENEDYLDNLAEVFKDIKRMPASPAMATFRFYVSEPQKQATIIPAGTRVSFDGIIMFETNDVLEIKAGDSYGDVEARCTQPGTVGNGFAPGQVKEIVDLFDHYQKAENITVTSGGAEREGNASYYERMRESMESFNTAGAVNSYIYYARSVSSAVKDVTAYSPEPGKVDVKVLLEDDGKLTDAVIQEIQEKLSKDDVRPLTDFVTVSEPEWIEFDIDATFYIEKTNSANAAIIEKNVRNAAEEYAEWQTGKIGRDINPSYLIQKMMEAGAKRVEVRRPEFCEVKNIAVGKLRNKDILNGGLEDV